MKFLNLFRSEEPLTVESNVPDDSIFDYTSLSMPRENKLETLQEIHQDAEYVEENSNFEYSSSLLESISFNMYSESTQNEIKKKIDTTKNAVFKVWSKVKDAYHFVAELNEEYIAKELELSKSQTYKHDGNYYSNVGLDTSI